MTLTHCSSVLPVYRTFPIELRDLGNLDFFGLLKTDGDRERVMAQIDSFRAKTVYSYSVEDCSDACKDRGGKAVICLNVYTLHNK